MAIVKVHNKARNVTYVYESESYWDKEKKQPRSHRKLIGRIDPETGEIVPTGGKGRAAASVDPSDTAGCEALYEQALQTIKEKDAIILELRSRVASLEVEGKVRQRAIDQACDILKGSVARKERNDG